MNCLYDVGGPVIINFAWNPVCLKDLLESKHSNRYELLLTMLLFELLPVVVVSS